MPIARRDILKSFGAVLIARNYLAGFAAQAEDYGPMVDMGQGHHLQYQIYGHENDMIRFLINASEIARDEIKNVTANVASYRWFGSTAIVAVIHGKEKDQVYGYAVTGNRVLRSPLWRDTHPGTLNLSAVNWSGNNTFQIPGDGSSGTMSYSGSWHCTADRDSVIEHDQKWL